ncbi:MAG TPA: AbrB/MazE/SpoVT family DNA-binding domain-containing protein [Patescibacteria group bacterium]
MSKQKILKVGNSLGVTLPSDIVKTLSIKPGDQVEVIKEAGNTITLNFIDSHQLSLGLNTTKHRTHKNI